MKLLVDQNLSRKLPAAVADLYPGSMHVRDLKMARAADTDIWDYAKENGFIIRHQYLVLSTVSRFRTSCEGHLDSDWKLLG